MFVLVQEHVEEQANMQAQEKSEASKAVLEALDMLMLHKQKIQDAIAKVKDTAQEHLQEVKQLAIA